MQAKIPFYAKASLIFIGLFAFVGMLHIAQLIIVPLIYSTIFAILLSPIVGFFTRKNMNRILAISLTFLIVFCTLILFFFLLSSQFNIFAETFPKLLERFYEALNTCAGWFSSHFHISTQKINTFVADTKTEIINSSRSAIASTLSTVGSALVILVLIPVYIFMILFYQPLLLEFIRRLFRNNNQEEVNEVLTSTKSIIQHYLVGLLLEAAIVATLNSVGLLILGIDYAIVLGIIGAIVNVIPYLGGIVAIILPMMVAFVTKDSLSYTILVLLVYLFIQFIDNHYLIPKIVASRVRLNALISIIVVLAGNALWGIPGMFLSIPLTAILKVIFDHIDTLKPWGFLLGDTVPYDNKIKVKIKHK